MDRDLGHPPGTIISWHRQGLILTADTDLLPPGWPGWDDPAGRALDEHSVDALLRERVANMLKPDVSDVAVAVYRSVTAGATVDDVCQVSGLPPTRVQELLSLGELIDGFPQALQVWLRRSRLKFRTLRKLRRASLHADDFTLKVIHALDARQSLFQVASAGVPPNE